MSLVTSAIGRITGNQINNFLNSLYLIVLFVIKVVIRICLRFINKAFLSLSQTSFVQMCCKSCINGFLQLVLTFLSSCCHKIDPSCDSFPVDEKVVVWVKKRAVDDRTGFITIHSWAYNCGKNANARDVSMAVEEWIRLRKGKSPRSKRTPAFPRVFIEDSSLSFLSSLSPFSSETSSLLYHDRASKTLMSSVLSSSIEGRFIKPLEYQRSRLAQNKPQAPAEDRIT